MSDAPLTAALIVAAGRGSRFGGPVPKQYAALLGRPVLRWTAERFAAHRQVGLLAVVIHPDDRAAATAALAGLEDVLLFEGGETRQRSVASGLEALAALPHPPAQVLIQDAARPLTSAATISAVIAALAEGPAALAAVPAQDTLKRAMDAQSPLVAGTLDRSAVWQAQTPQGFRLPEILAAHRMAEGLALTDDAAVAEAAGLPVRLVPSTGPNFKITRTEDLAMAERLLSPMLLPRVGFGYDVHAFVPGDFVTLGGVRIPHDRKLDGHSDADALLHALTDALLGALAAGDIGQHFPPSDPRWKGADSRVFLAHAAEMVRARGGRIANVDVMVIAEAPRLGPHRPAMQAVIAEVLGIAPGQVGVKATTNEKMGFAGRGEGLAAQAVATVLLPLDEGAL